MEMSGSVPTQLTLRHTTGSNGKAFPFAKAFGDRDRPCVFHREYRIGKQMNIVKNGHMARNIKRFAPMRVGSSRWVPLF